MSEIHGEEVIFSTRTHPKMLIAPVIGVVVLTAVAIGIGRIDPDVFNSQLVASAVYFARLAGWAVCVIVALIWVLVPVLRWRSSVFTITDRRIQMRSGFFTRRGSDIPLARVTNIETERGLLDRIFGCGTLIVRDAGSLDGIVLRDIPKVRDVQTVLGDLVHDATSFDQEAPEV